MRGAYATQTIQQFYYSLDSTGWPNRQFQFCYFHIRDTSIYMTNSINQHILPDQIHSLLSNDDSPHRVCLYQITELLIFVNLSVYFRCEKMKIIESRLEAIATTTNFLYFCFLFLRVSHNSRCTILISTHCCGYVYVRLNEIETMKRALVKTSEDTLDQLRGVRESLP